MRPPAEGESSVDTPPTLVGWVGKVIEGKDGVGNAIEVIGRDVPWKDIDGMDCPGREGVGTTRDVEGRETPGNVGCTIVIEGIDTVGKERVGTPMETDGMDCPGRDGVGCTIEIEGIDTVGKERVGTPMETDGMDCPGTDGVATIRDVEGRETPGEVGRTIEIEGTEAVGEDKVGTPMEIDETDSPGDDWVGEIAGMVNPGKDGVGTATETEGKGEDPGKVGTAMESVRLDGEDCVGSARVVDGRVIAGGVGRDNVPGTEGVGMEPETSEGEAVAIVGSSGPNVRTALFVAKLLGSCSDADGSDCTGELKGLDSDSVD